MLILPMVYDSMDYDELIEYIDLAIKLVKEGKIDEARIDESVRRILKLKEKYGLLEEKDFSVTQEKIDKAVETWETTSSEVLEQMGRNGRRAAEEKYSYRKLARDFAELFNTEAGERT